MGEYLLAEKLKKSGAAGRIEVSSAGIEATPGLPATSGSRRAIERRFGKDHLKGHRATLLTPALMGECDAVLVMTRGQKAFLEDQWAGVVEGLDAKLHTLGEFAGQPKVDVDDPVGGPDARYDDCRDLLEELMSAAAKRLTNGPR
jgi:protein-tyrosine-phosphatase